jgi:hypothetical protein
MLLIEIMAGLYIKSVIIGQSKKKLGSIGGPRTLDTFSFACM